MPQSSSYWHRMASPALFASTLLNPVRLAVDLVTSADRARVRWPKRWHRRLASMPRLTQWVVALVATVVIGFADLITSRDIAFSVFYLFPMAYATWFLGARAGCLIGVLGATIWLFAQRAFTSDSSALWISAWNGAVGLVFFVISIIAVALAKRSATRLIREVEQRTSSLRDEVGRRRRLEREMLEMSARQQLRLAQDLHDGLGQYLSALAFHSRMLADDLQQHQSPYAGQAERMVMLIRKTNQITRQLNGTLQVPEARNGGLVAACRSLVTEFEQLTGVRCELVVGQEPPPLDEFKTIMLFRIVQEAFNNSVKHARPRSIRVTFASGREGFALQVVNDGHNGALHGDTDRGSGSLVMKLRAELIGAHFEAGPATEEIYKVQCRLPVNGVPANAAAN